MFDPADHLEQIKGLIDAVIKDLPSKHTVEWYAIPRAQIFKLVLQGAYASIIERRVTIEHIGADNTFEIEYRAELKAPKPYVLSSKKERLTWGSTYTYSRIHHDLIEFLQQHITEMKVVEMVKHLTKLEEINKEFNGSDARVELYNQRDYDRPEWRFKLVSTNDKTVYVDSLAPDKADWHTYRMFYLGIDAANKRGISFGITHTAETMVERIVIDSFRSSGLRYEDMPQVVSNSLRNR